MNRVRWLRAEWSIPMCELADGMKRYAFTRDSFDGFVIDRVRDTFIEGRYIEKVNYQETITSPFGEEQFFERIAYQETPFTLFTEYPHVELHNPPRSVKAFMSKLLEMCKFSVSISPVYVDLLNWVAEFQLLSTKEILVDVVQVSEVVLAEGIGAKMLIRGNKDIREVLGMVVGERKFNLDKVQMRCAVEGKTIPIHLSTTGVIKVPRR